MAETTLTMKKISGVYCFGLPKDIRNQYDMAEGDVWVVDIKKLFKRSPETKSKKVED